MAKQFFNTGGVDLNLLAQLAVMEEKNRDYENQKAARIPQAIIGGATQLGQGLLTAQKEQKMLDEKNARWKQDQKLTGQKMALQYGEGGRQYPVGEETVFKAGEKPQKGQSWIQTRTDGTYIINRDPNTGKTVAEKIQGVPGKRLSESSWYATAQDRVERDRVNQAEAAYDREYKKWKDANPQFDLMGNPIPGAKKFNQSLDDFYRKYKVKNILMGGSTPDEAQ